MPCAACTAPFTLAPALAHLPPAATAAFLPAFACLLPHPCHTCLAPTTTHTLPCPTTTHHTCHPTWDFGWDCPLPPPSCMLPTLPHACPSLPCPHYLPPYLPATHLPQLSHISPPGFPSLPFLKPSPSPSSPLKLIPLDSLDLMIRDECDIDT